jgi:hypothetical protein
MIVTVSLGAIDWVIVQVSVLPDGGAQLPAAAGIVGVPANSSPGPSVSVTVTGADVAMFPALVTAIV